MHTMTEELHAAPREGKVLNGWVADLQLPGCACEEGEVAQALAVGHAVRHLANTTDRQADMR